jgi:hypothetical protein
LGDFLGDFSLSLGDFLTETSGPPGHRYLDIFRFVMAVLERL